MGGTQRTHPDDALFMDAASSLGVSLEELARGVEQVAVKAQRETEMAPNTIEPEGNADGRQLGVNVGRIFCIFRTQDSVDGRMSPS